MVKKLTDVNDKVVQELLKKIMDDAKERKFVQTIDVGVNLQGINFKVPQNRVDVTIELPNPFKGTPKVLLFVKDKNLSSVFKDVVDKVIHADDIPTLKKKDVKKYARDYDLFFAEPPAMALIGKHLGQILAPRGKMPKPAPPNPEVIKNMIQIANKSVRISNKKGKFLPTVHFSVGQADMDLAKVSKNFIACFDKLMEFLPGKSQNVKSLYLKTTMGKAEYLYRK